jgi:hypothetical protein
MKTYVVTMYRWGDREKHSYVHGVYGAFKKALKAALEEKAYRGGNKYYPEILMYNINTPKSSEEECCSTRLITLEGWFKDDETENA